MTSMRALQSEWTKIKSVRSTLWTLTLAFVVTLTLGAVISIFIRNNFANLPADERTSFDATYTSFSGMGLGQLAMIVFGVMVVSCEYSTNTIRVSLAAVPRRAIFLFGKVAAASGLAFLVGFLTSFVTFFVGQALLGEHRASLGDTGVLRGDRWRPLYGPHRHVLHGGRSDAPQPHAGPWHPDAVLLPHLIHPGRRGGHQEGRPISTGPGGRPCNASGHPAGGHHALRAMGRSRHHGGMGGGGTPRRLFHPPAAGRLTQRNRTASTPGGLLQRHEHP